MKKYIYLGVLGAFLLGSCTGKGGHDHEAAGHEKHEETHQHEGHVHDEHEGHAHGEHEGHTHGGSDEIILTPEKARAAGVEVGTAETGTFHQVIKTSGQVLAAQGDERTMVATVSGVVSFRGKVVEGMSVSKGTPLLTLSSQGIAEGDPVQRAKVAYETARKEYERLKPLAESRIVSQREFLQAEQAYEQARIAYEAVAQNHSAGGQTVTAPIGGYVKSLLVREGDYVTVGTPLASITQNRRLFLRADVSEKYYQALRTIGSANFCTPYNDRVYSLRELDGRLLSYGKSGGEAGNLIPVTFEFDNRADILPGSFVEVYLLSTPMEGVLSLPRTALTEEQGNYFVYLQLDEEGYRKQRVTPGADDGERVQIMEGVHPGDRVVMRGAYQVKLAAATNAIPAHSHEH